MRRNHTMRGIPFALAALMAALLGVSQPARAQSEIFDDLLEKLREKGVLSDAEYNALKQARDEERVEQRAERRKQAMKEAQTTEKEEKAKEEEKTALKGRFRNGFTWETGDKSAMIGLAGRVQLDYRNFADDIFPNTFDVRRAYLGAYGRFFNDFTFEVTADFAQTTASQLDVAWLNWGAYQGLQLRAGQFKMPMSLEELTSSRFIDFQERSFVNSFVPAKERGVMLHGTPFTGWFYGVALSNGQGKNNNEVSNTADDFDVIARLGVNVAEMLQQKDMVIHVAGAYSKGDLPTATTGATGNMFALRTEGRGVTFFQVANSTITGDDVSRERMLGELSLAWGPIKAQGEYITVNLSGTNVGGVDYDRDITAAYAELMWLISGETYASAYRNGAYGRIVPKTNFSLKDGTWGAFEIGVRFSQFDGEDFTTGNPAGTGVLGAGFTNKAEAWTVGLKWIMNPNTRMYLNYVKTDFDTPINVVAPGTPAQPAEQFDEEEAITLRLGIDF